MVIYIKEEVGRMYYGYNFTEEEISRAFNIPVGKVFGTNKYEKNSVKWYKLCYRNLKVSSIGGKRRQELYPNLSSEIMKLNNEKYPNLPKEAGLKGGVLALELKLGIHAMTHEERVEVGKKVQRLYPNLSNENVKKTNKTIEERRKDLKYDKWYRNTHKMGGKNAQKVLKRKKLDIYGMTKEELSKAGEKAGKKRQELYPNLSSEIMKKTNQKYPNLAREAGIISIKSQRKNKHYYYNDAPFDTNQERECGKTLHTTINLPLIEGDTCHFRVDGGEIDFRIPKQYVTNDYDVFLEYHPCEWFLEPRSYIEYCQQRRQLLDKNGFKNNKLIVVQNLDELKTINW